MDAFDRGLERSSGDDGSAGPAGLEVHGVRKSFGPVEVLHGITLDARAGEVLMLLGENGAGKSTLVKILAGDQRPDGGYVILDGHRYEHLDPRLAQRVGVNLIHQEFVDAPELSIAENISLGRWPAAGRAWVRWRQVRRHAVDVLQSLGAELDVTRAVGTLRVGERQLVEIARAMSAEARCLIFDEPTAAISEEETNRLFTLIGRLRAAGIVIIYITHRLDELERIGDTLAVLRDGNVVLSGRVSEIPVHRIISAMTGERDAEVAERNAEPAISRGPVRLELRDGSVSGAFSHVTVSARAGEIVTLYGKLGSGVGEVTDALFGRRRLDSGQLVVGARERAHISPHLAIESGLGYLGADRKAEGAFFGRPIRENLCAPSWPRLAHGGFLSGRGEERMYKRWSESMKLHAHRGAGQDIATLSGGNQQKVILARWFVRESEVLILVEPTRGVDVSARRDIYAVLRSRCEAGVAIVVGTSDVAEAAELSDTVIVLSRGRVAKTLRGDEITKEQLVAAAGGDV